MKDNIRKLEEITEKLEKRIRKNSTEIYIVLIGLSVVAFVFGMMFSEYWSTLLEVSSQKYSYYEVSKEQLLKLVQSFGKIGVLLIVMTVGVAVSVSVDIIRENRKFRRIVKELEEVQEEMKNQVRDEKQEQH